MHTLRHAFVALVAFASSAFALTTPQSPSSFERQESEWFRFQRELAAWRADHGPTWKAEYDRQTGWARLVFGGATQALFTPRQEADFVSLAREALRQSAALTGLDAETLVFDSAVHLPLSLAGSSDKYTVQFRQELSGVPVEGGFANVLFDLEGRVLAVDTTALPSVSLLESSAAIDAAGAWEDAQARFQADTGLVATEARPSELWVAQVRRTKLREPALAWITEVHFASDGFAPVGWRYVVDAASGELLRRDNAVHHFDVSGQVKSMATPGTHPDYTGNDETSQGMPYLTVTSAQGNATTDSNGNFTIVGATAPVTVTVTYDGTWSLSDNVSGTDYSLATTLNSASGNTVNMNPSSAATTTAEANAFQWIGKMRDWTRSVNPSDSKSDFQAQTNTNLNSTCNAYFDGVSTNYYLAGGGCVNTAYSTVVLHEMGHWLNVRYNSGNGGDGFGEGNADNFSTFITDDPIVGYDFCGSGCHVRDANNNRQYCGDGNGGCYGEVHADGEVLMGACWKVRTKLKTSLGTSAGILTSNLLFNGWMNANNDSQIDSIIRTHWLVIDDDDGNIDNGTPHFTEIDDGFAQQGFPNYVIQGVSFANVTDLPDSQNETGPYTVQASIVANQNGPITSASIFYRSNNGSYVSTPMSLVSGSTWSGQIPNLASPAFVDYYLSATNAGAQSRVYPDGAPANVLSFRIGQETVYWSEGFESGTNGWTHGQIAVQDDWQLSSAQGGVGANGESGDPTAAYAGQNIWGNDLGFGTFNGAYTDNVHNWLRSPTVNMSGKTALRLKFQRWLTVEQGIYDQARIKVNGTQVWVNPSNVDLLDTAWTETDIDIGAIANNNPSVQLEFSLQSDVGLTFGGWNIDALQIYALTASCGAPSGTQPADLARCPGTSASFSTTASGVGPFTYQWEKNGAPIGGATASSYVIASVGAGDAGNYTCVITNACGSSETLPGVLTINTSTSATTPANQTVCPGGGASFSTSASGTGPFVYQWKKNGAAIGGATNSVLSLTNVQAGDAGTYSVAVTGACNSVEPSATLTVNVATGATTPSSQTVCAGAGVSFSTSASGTGPFGYQWKKNGVAIGGATSATLNLSNVQSGDAATYSVAVTGACNTVEPSATLTVNATTTASTPANQTVCEGSGASFSTTVGGTGPFTYQWKKDGTPIGGATSATLNLANVQSGDAGSYSVLVTGACGSSEPGATLAVNPSTSATTPSSQSVCPGTGVVFSTSAGGTGPFTYQWKKDGLPIGGETGSSLSLANPQPADAGTYSVLVTGACGSVEPSASLTLLVPASASTPGNQTVCPGGGASFSTTAGGTGPFTYQWKKDGTPLSGETASTLSLANVQAGDAGSYSVLVTGACGSVEPSATLALLSPTSATEPSDDLVCAGESASFSTTPSGSGPFTFQWKKNGTPIGGETSSSLSLSNVGAADAATYSVLVTGACGSVEPDAVLQVFGTTVSYCTSKLNSIGQFPTIGSSGTPGVSANDFVLALANAVPGKVGLAFWGTAPNGAPFNGGHLCVLPPLIRLSLHTADGGGAMSEAIPVDLSMIGTTRYYQWWQRDPADPFTVSLSDGLEVTFCD